MTLEQKQKVVEATKDYIKAKGLSNSEFSRIAKINGGYVSQMLRGLTQTKAGGKMVEIQDKYFIMMADAIGMKSKSLSWQKVFTPQFQQIIFELNTAKQTGSTRVLIGETGCGKTYVTDVFVKQMPLNTYRITVSRMHTLTDIINEFLQSMGVAELGSKASKMKKMIAFLREVGMSGGLPQLIVDEAENLKTPVFGLLKGLFDGIKSYCSIVIIGTPELLDKMESMKRREKEGMPQFFRRFKAGIRRIDGIDRRFPEFMEMFVEDKGLRKLLCELCDNFGELNDFLEPCLKEAQRLGKPLTEELFRQINNLPQK